MLKLQIIGHIGQDAIMHQHGTDNVLNFSVAHTDKYKNADGTVVNKTTWISCSWWIDGRSTVGQYLKKGTLVWIEGIPEAKMWENKEKKKACGLGVRIIKLELLGNKREEGQGSAHQTQSESNGYTPYVSDEPPF
jgi:single-strand DNA-binding protein